MDEKTYWTWSLTELKVELKKRGASVKGKKAELVDRLELYDRNFNFNTPQLSPNADPAMVLPPLDEYHDINSNTRLPPLERQIVRFYFERFSKKTDMAEKLYEARFLLLARAAFVSDYYYIRGFVKKTMKKLQYQVDIKIDQYGVIEECHCECPAGAGTEAHCKHVGVLLFAVLHMVKYKIMLTTQSQTQKLQTFHRPRKIFSGSPVKAQHLQRKKQTSLFEAFPICEMNKKNYNNRLRNLVLNCNFNIPLKQLYTPANPIGICHDHDYLKYNQEEIILRKLKLIEISTDDIEAIQKETIDQNENPLWHNYRSIRITASVFHTVCNLKSNSQDAFAKQMLQKKKFTSRATAHGLANEKIALRKYAELYDLNPVECGLFISKDRPYLGASPDALLGEETIIEIKCPYTCRNKLISPETVPYITVENNILTLKKTSPYYYQVQGQMYCSGRKYCNFIIYTFKDLEVIFINRDELLINNMMSKLDNFYNDFLKTKIINKYLYKDYYNVIKKHDHYSLLLFIIQSLKLHSNI